MKILHTVEFYQPSVGGAQEVVKQLSRRLVDSGHEVTVATTNLPERRNNIIDGVRIKEFKISGNLVRGFTGTKREIERYQSLLTSDRFDVVMNYAAQQWATDLALPILNKIIAKKVFVPCGFSGLYDPRYKEYFGQMPNWLKQYDASVYLSNNYRDVNFAKKHRVNHRVLIPNGAGEDEFLVNYDGNIREELGVSDDDYLILTVGSHTGHKGHAEMIEVFDKANIFGASLVIVANSFGGGCTDSCTHKASVSKWNFGWKLKNKRLVVKELTRKQTVALYKEADMFVLASNVECSPLVLFEAAASKTPFLCTDVGNAREIVRWIQGGRVLPTSKDRQGYSHLKIDEAIKILERFYKQRSLGQRMGMQGYKSWKRRFTWEKITRRYESLYLNLIKSKKKELTRK